MLGLCLALLLGFAPLHLARRGAPVFESRCIQSRMNLNAVRKVNLPYSSSHSITMKIFIQCISSPFKHPTPLIKPLTLLLLITLSLNSIFSLLFLNNHVQVTTEEFERELEDCATPIVLDVYAQWCGPCQLMSPQLEQVAQKLGDKVRILKVDSDEDPEVADALQVRGLPTILFIRDMSVVMRAEGALMADELHQLIDHHFFDGPPPSIDGLQTKA